METPDTRGTGRSGGVAGAPSCGRYQASCLSDRIFFRKDWDPRASVRKRRDGVTLQLFLRASEASE